jgi:hypothetical protein
VKRAVPSSKTKVANTIQIRHRDEVEAPITGWLQEAYDFNGTGTRKGGWPASTKATADKSDAPGQRKPSKKPAAKPAKRNARGPGR